MKQVKITKKEHKFLTQISESDYSGDGDGFSDYITDLDYDMKVVRGLMSSLIQKGVIYIEDGSYNAKGEPIVWAAVQDAYFDMDEYKLTNLITK